MCVSNPIQPSASVSSTRDTSNELIKSKYELSDENKKRNQEILQRRQQSLINLESEPKSGINNYQVGKTGEFRATLTSPTKDLEYFGKNF